MDDITFVGSERRSAMNDTFLGSATEDELISECRRRGIWYESNGPLLKELEDARVKLRDAQWKLKMQQSDLDGFREAHVELGKVLEKHVTDWGPDGVAFRVAPWVEQKLRELQQTDQKLKDAEAELEVFRSTQNAKSVLIAVEWPEDAKLDSGRSVITYEPPCVCGKEHGPGPARSRASEFAFAERGPGIEKLPPRPVVADEHYVDPLDLLADEE